MDWTGFSTALGLVFVAELGDKTQLAVIAQVCKYRRPWPVFAGAALALAAVSGIGAGAGRLIAAVVPPGLISLAAALAFVAMGLVVWLQSARRSDVPACPGPDEPAPPAGGRPGAARILASTAGLLLLAEMGDKTQLAVIAMVGQGRGAAAVFAGAVLALTAVTALAVLGGEALCRLVPQSWLMRAAALAFVAVGIWMLVGLS